MNDPERRTQQGDILNQDALALVEVNHLWTQTIGGTELTLVHGNTILSIFQQTGTGTHVLGNAALLHAKLLAAAPGPPGLVSAATVDSSLTCHGNILGLVSINQWREVPAIQPLPTCRDDGVELRLESEFEYGTFVNHEVDARLQLNGCCQESLSRRNDDATAAFLRTFVDGLLNGLLVLGGCVGGFCAELGNHILLVRKLWHTDALFNLLVLLLIPAFCLGSNYHQHDEHHGVK